MNIASYPVSVLYRTVPPRHVLVVGAAQNIVDESMLADATDQALEALSCLFGDLPQVRFIGTCAGRGAYIFNGNRYRLFLSLTRLGSNT